MQSVACAKGLSMLLTLLGGGGEADDCLRTRRGSHLVLRSLVVSVFVVLGGLETTWDFDSHDIFPWPFLFGQWETPVRVLCVRLYVSYDVC